MSNLTSISQWIIWNRIKKYITKHLYSEWRFYKFLENYQFDLPTFTTTENLYKQAI